jgi:hypothetical protein
MACGTAMVSMPSCTTPMFSKMPVTSQLTQPATLAIVQASGSAVATVPASMLPARPQHDADAAVLTSSSAFSADSVVMKVVISRMCARDGAGVLVDDLAHIGVLVARAGEELDREDVGVAVHHAAHDLLRSSLLALARSRMRGTKWRRKTT